MQPNITTIIQQKKQFHTSHCKNVTEQGKQIAIYTNAINVIPAVFVFSIRKIIRHVDVDKIANLAQHPKSLGTADLQHTKPYVSNNRSADTRSDDTPLHDPMIPKRLSNFTFQWVYDSNSTLIL